MDKSLKIKAVIKDPYFFNLNWEKKINSLFKLIVIDDRLKTSHHADLYINYNYDKNYIKNKINLKFVKRLIGQKYFITNKNKVSNKRKSKPNFFIYLGSVDSNNFSLKIFNYLKKNYNNKITFLTPQFNTKILSTIQNNRRKKYKYHKPESKKYFKISSKK